MTAHWGIPDPAAVEGSAADIERAYRDAFFMLDRRISLFLALPIEKLSNLALQKEVDDIGKDATAAVSPAGDGKQ
jgi:arsenate reductase